jgi:hypothetical protein
MGISLYLNDKSNICLIKDKDRHMYTLIAFDKGGSRHIIWRMDKHKKLTALTDKVFKG